MATTDLHMHLTGYDYCAGCADPAFGLTRTASLIAAARAEAEKTGALALLFDNGDALSGSPMGDVAAARPDRPNPLMRAARYLRYDALGLGNHDFDGGLPALDALLRQAPCPVVCTNLRRRDGRPPAPPGHIARLALLDREVPTAEGPRPIRIGVLSFLPPQTLVWNAPVLAGAAEIEDIVASARAILPRLAEAGCDVTVALAHSGLGPLAGDGSGEHDAAPLAALEGIDAVIAGHTHLLLPGADHPNLAHVDAARGRVHGKPVVMPGFGGAHLGLIDLDLAADRHGRWTVRDAVCTLRPIAARRADGRAEPLVPEDAGLVAELAADHAATREMLEQPVAAHGQALHSYFTFFAPDRSLALVAAAQAAALRPHLAGTPGEGLPVLSAVAPGKFGARAGPLSFTDVPPGPVRQRHLIDLHVFPNDLCAAIVTAGQLIDWLEMSASLFHHIPPGARDADLLDPAIPGHDFDVIYGLTYEIDLARPARFTPDGGRSGSGSRRTGAIRYRGAPITDDMRFVVALNSHRASGGGRVAALRDAPRIELPPLPIRDALRDYLAGVLARDALQDAPHPWRFAPMPGTRVTVQTGPGAAKHLSELDGRDVQQRGVGPSGFLTLSVPL